MTLGMQIALFMQLLQLTLSTIFVYWTHDDLIFPDRVAPKFVFDMFRCIIILGFALCWM